MPAEDFALGTAGAGVGALTANLKGGLGSALAGDPGGFTVGALVVANPTGSVTMGDSAHFWAAPFEVEGEFGGLGPLTTPMPFAQTVRSKRDLVAPITNTTIAIVATDADLSKAQLKRFAVAAQDGIARGCEPGAYAGGWRPDLLGIDGRSADRDAGARTCCSWGMRRRCCLSRAMARAIYLATPAAGDPVPTWREDVERLTAHGAARRSALMW